MTAIEDIAAERQRQIEQEGWTAEHDDSHDIGELATAAACYASPDLLYRKDIFANAIYFVDPWPWSEAWDKRLRGGNMILPNSEADPAHRRRMLVMAGALIAAEIDRLDRAKTARRETVPAT